MKFQFFQDHIEPKNGTTVKHSSKFHDFLKISESLGTLYIDSQNNTNNIGRNMTIICISMKTSQTQ